jgi:hypothetical protein
MLAFELGVSPRPWIGKAGLNDEEGRIGGRGRLLQGARRIATERPDTSCTGRASPGSNGDIPLAHGELEKIGKVESASDSFDW